MSKIHTWSEMLIKVLFEVTSLSVSRLLQLYKFWLDSSQYSIFTEVCSGAVLIDTLFMLATEVLIKKSFITLISDFGSWFFVTREFSISILSFPYTDL